MSFNRFLAKTPEVFTYDADGNMLTDGRWDYFYDAENQLIRMETGGLAVTAGVLERKLEFKYDYLNRRIEKKVYTWNGSSWTPDSTVKFIYKSGEHCLLAELDTSNNVLRSYFWGLDLTDTLYGAGGTGGMLMVGDGSNTYAAGTDYNGNLTTLTNLSTGSIVAAYEYSAFGETLRETGTFASDNPFRSATHFTDKESGLVYYGLRYYHPSKGRFINRDPLGEAGGLNLYGFVGNDPVNSWDYLGMENHDIITLPDFPVYGDPWDDEDDWDFFDDGDNDDSYEDEDEGDDGGDDGDGGDDNGDSDGEDVDDGVYNDIPIELAPFNVYADQKVNTTPQVESKLKDVGTAPMVAGQSTERRTFIVMYDEHEVVYTQLARLMTPVRFIGKFLYKMGKYINSLDPFSQSLLLDWLNPNDYPTNIGGFYLETLKSYYPGNYEFSGTNYLGSKVIRVISSDQILLNPRFVDYLDFKFNIDARSISQINVRRHYTEYLYSPPEQ